MAIGVYSKDPDSKLDYTIDWSAWLASGETIVASAWAIDVNPDNALTISVSPVPSSTPSTATLWLEAGTLNQRYTVRNRITTNQGRTEDRSFFVRMETH